MYHFTYQTKCIPTGKTYIGVHSTNKLNDGYIGCGIASANTINSQIKANRTSPILNAIYKYGYENFTLEVLSFFDTKEEAYEEEAFLVDASWVSSDSNYNIKPGGIGGTTLPKLLEHKDDIISMYLSGATYREISKKYNVSKGSYIYFLTPYLGTREKRKSFYCGTELENVYGDVVEFENAAQFYALTGVSTKTLHKMISKGQEVAYGNLAWFFKGSDRLKAYRIKFFSNSQHWRATRLKHDKIYKSMFKNRAKK